MPISLIDHQKCDIAGNSTENTKYFCITFTALQHIECGNCGNSSECQQILNLRVTEIVDIYAKTEQIDNAQYEEIEQVAADDISNGGIVISQTKQCYG